VKLSWREYALKLRHPFTIARGSSSTKQVIVTHLEHEGIVGFGEAAPSSRYGESIETVKAFLGKVDLQRFDDPLQLESILRYVDTVSEGNYAAKAAIDIALHDWRGKKLAIPLYRYWGLDKGATPLTSFTIGIDTPQVLVNKIEEAEPYPLLKIKLGTDQDEEIIRTIRRITQKTLRVDANEGWKNKETAVERIKWLEQEGVELVEQPMPASDLDGTAWVRERVNLPLIADENCIRYHDIPGLQNAFDGINIKLMKCTGLHEAMKMIHTARACHMKVMVGCMIETSVAITAAAHLSPLIDFADLDGNVLITNDPFIGMTIVGGKITLPDRAGIGVREK
jgi:L-alanine-DL-glutamate epimerase-like enolase superfamily enzyme